MNVEKFFDLVLPDGGWRCVAMPSNGKMAQSFGHTNKWLNDAAQTIDKRELNAFFACATFKERNSRLQTNVHAVKSFWLDVDCGDGKPYATIKDGAKAALTFAKKLNLPAPILVKSGNGVHVYWPLSEELTPVNWTERATKLKAACKLAGLWADPSRTSDCASVLRVPNTHHRKTTPKLVTVVFEGDAPVHPDIFSSTLDAYLAQHNYIPAPVGAVTKLAINDDLSGGIDYPQSYAAKVAQRCGVIALMRDTKGNVDQPTWFHSLGVLAFTEEADAICHEWSSGHPHYSPAETDTKIEQVRKFRPTSCAKLSDYQPAICGACPHNGKIKTPLSLGIERPDTVVPTEQLSFGGVATAATPQHVVLPYGYRWHQNANGYFGLEALTGRDDNGNEEWDRFCETLFYPVNRVYETEEDAYCLEIEMQVKPGQSRRFMVKCSTVAEGGKSLAGQLGRFELVPLNPRMKPHMDAYLSSWMDQLRKTAQEVGTHKNFGWVGKNFLVGNRLITPDGDRLAIVRGAAASKAKALTPQGSLETWKAAIDKAYNYEGQEAFQFMVMSSFAAPLFAMFGQYGGITIYAHSEGSGVGKTTAQRAGLSAWGSWQDLQLSDGKTTANALWALIGTYHNLPVLFDELTNTQNSAASEVVFSVSSGRGKERLTSSGELRTNNSNWSTIVMASGNNLLSEKLSLHRYNAEAELSRLFEFTVRKGSRLTPNEAAELFPLLATNYGHAGEEFIRYVVKNYDAVEQALWAVQRAFNAEVKVTQVERYWAALQVSVLVALKICQKLGLVGFDTAALKTWLVDRINDNRGHVVDAVNDPLEQFGKMLSDLWQGILITEGEGDVRKGAFAVVAQEPRGPLVGRAIVIVRGNNQPSNEKPVLLLNGAAVKEWCNKKGVSAKEMQDAAVHAGWLQPQLLRYSLGRGTATYASISSHVRCWVIDPEKMAAETSVGFVTQRFRVIGGDDVGAGGSDAGSAGPVGGALS